MNLSSLDSIRVAESKVEASLKKQRGVYLASEKGFMKKIKGLAYDIGWVSPQKTLEKLKDGYIKKKANIDQLIQTIDDAKSGFDKKLAVEKFNKMIALYLDKNFEEALALLKKMDKNEKVVELYIDRINNFIKNPPKDNWDGIFVLKIK